MFDWFKRAKEPEIGVEEEAEIVERRVAERNDTYADVVAKSNSGRFLKRGIALDLSANGARLRFENGDSLLDGMVVNISRYGVKRRGRMRWRTRTDVGIEFINDEE
ncbi:MAG: PilZ domain-containing protein [Hyphomonadaceae bacterium]|nr:PilZ domain-containing protein [Hyphomonadaceae bacterium]